MGTVKTEAAVSQTDRCPCRVVQCYNHKHSVKMYRQLMGLRQLSKRSFCGSARRQIENTIKDKQKLFQEDNGVPIHLKGGTKDALLYRTTIGLTIFGSFYVVYVLYNCAMPKKAE